MSNQIEELAEKITELEPDMQESLLVKIAELNFKKGLTKLSQKYRRRLAQESRLNETSEEIFGKLRAIREETAAEDYPDLAS